MGTEYKERGAGIRLDGWNPPLTAGDQEAFNSGLMSAYDAYVLSRGKRSEMVAKAPQYEPAAQVQEASAEAVDTTRKVVLFVALATAVGVAIAAGLATIISIFNGVKALFSEHPYLSAGAFFPLLYFVLWILAKAQSQDPPKARPKGREYYQRQEQGWRDFE